MKPCAIFAATLLTCSLLCACAAQQAHFGDAPKMENEKPLSVPHITSAPENYEGKYVRVKGTVRDLCTTSGCWMEIARDTSKEEPALLVVFTYDKTKYRVPPDAKGHEAIVEGTVSIREISQADRRHYAEDSGASPEEIAKIIGPEKIVRLECPAATIKGVEPATPQACEHE
jgi:hypothetical protein